MPNNPTIAAGQGLAAKATGKAATLPALAAAFLGVVFLYGVGFSHIEAVHNAAHDTRHANAFPCH
jgi:cobalt transporter subunit CbtB (proposed)